MLSIRKKGEFYYVRGTVKEGTKKRPVKEQRTGCRDERTAKAFAEQLEKQVQAELRLGIEPPKPEDAPPPPLTFDEAAKRYIANYDPPKSDLWRLRKFILHFDTKELQAIDAGAWDAFCRDVLPGRDVNTLARYQTTLRDVFAKVGAGVPFPENIAHGAEKRVRVRWLPLDQADRLINAYAYKDADDPRKSAKSPFAQAIGLTFRFLGVRTQECLQIQRSHIDDKRGRHGEVFIPESKNGLSRWIPIHPRVREAWEPILAAPARSFIIPGRGALTPLFLTDKGLPYRDSRINGDGGNPFARAHRAACKRAGVDDFTPHDWRHHWATWCLKSGMDIRTLQQLGGWQNLSMLEHYAAVDMDHAGDLLARVK